MPTTGWTHTDTARQRERHGIALEGVPTARDERRIRRAHDDEREGQARAPTDQARLNSAALAVHGESCG